MEAIPLKTHVVLGICAMHKKSHSTPMEQILDRIRKYILIHVVVFSEDTILHKPIEEWHSCDAFLSFYSTGFPLAKAIEYADKYQPFIINDLKMQYALLDRVEVYQALEEAGIEIPRHAVLRRDGIHSDEELGLTEESDSIDINGVIFQKPFVEKPLYAEDHRVHIYYPSSAGGGQTQLFRKVKDRSSIFITDSKIRGTGSFIYEEFIRTNGADVKVYSIGPDYAHAEARKSPSLDGKVDRDQYGKEIRYPVMLTAKEKAIAKTIAITFKHNVCGFDLLRTKGKMYVCDVNGFSFVKSSPKYFDDAGVLLTSIILENQAPYLINEIPRVISGHQDIPIIRGQSSINLNLNLDPTLVIKKQSDELRCVIAVIRHGDRNPKQKIKFVISHPRFTELFSKVNVNNKDTIKVKKPKHLQEFLDLVKEVLNTQEEEFVIASKAKELNQMKTVLEMYGKFSGINRKIQMKRQIKKGSQDVRSKEHSFLLILKWGGELTNSGKTQAEQLGRHFRLRYPGDHENYNSLPGSGFLRLHSTYRHDLKIYASDEGRVQMTAAAFVKGLLELEGGISSILVHLVKCDSDSTSLLDTSSNDNIIMAEAKNRLHQVMKTNQTFNDSMIDELASTRSPSLLSAIKKVGNPYDQCLKVNSKIHNLVKHLQLLRDVSVADEKRLEVLDLMVQRWEKLKKDFYDLKSNTFDISKIPDLYDCIKYDMMHNREYLFKDAAQLYNKSKALADIVIPQEYGITIEEKLGIAKTICNPLLKKIVSDFLHIENNSYAEHECFHLLNPTFSTDVETPKRHVRTRLYFTSESHVHSLFNILMYGGIWEEDDKEWIEAKRKLEEVSELNYNTQIIFHIYEDSTKSESDPDHLYAMVYFSPGLKTVNVSDEMKDETLDTVNCDTQYDREYLFKDAAKLYNKSKALADIVIPQEYGITIEEKLGIAKTICNPLLKKIVSDFLHIENNSYAEHECFHLLNPTFSTDVETPKRHVRTRLYFTSESHVHSLFNILMYGGIWEEDDKEWIEAKRKLEEVSELNYNTQIIFHIYEDSTKSESDPDHLYAMVYFSPGLKTVNVSDEMKDETLDTVNCDTQYDSSTTDFLNYQQPYRTQSLDALANLNLNQQNSTFRTSRRHSTFDATEQSRMLQYSLSSVNLIDEILDGPLSLQTPFKVGTSSLKQIMSHFSQQIDQKPNKY